MKFKINTSIIYVYLLFVLTQASFNASAVITVGLLGDGCDYDTLIDAYNDADPVVHITSQLTYSDVFTILKQKILIGGYDDCTAAENGDIGSNRTIWRRFDDATVVTINANAASQSLVTISNFEIFGGRDVTFSGAGGLKIQGKSSVLISNSDIHNNSGDLGGGISIFGTNASVVLTNSKIRNNTAQTAGAGIYCESSASVTIQNQSAISDNVSDGTGGGIHALSECQITLNSGDTLGTFQMQEGIFANVAETFGGGIYAKTGADVFLTGDLTHPASVSFNVTNTAGITESGGGIYATGAGTSVIATNARIDLNFTQQFGAGVVFEDFATFSMNRLDGACWDNDKCSSLSDNFTSHASSGAAAGSFDNAATAQISQTYIARNKANGSSVFSIGNAAYLRMEGNLLTANTSNTQALSGELISLYGAAATGANLDFFYNTVKSNNSSAVFKLFGNDSQQTISVKSSIINNPFNIVTTTGAMSHMGTFDCLIVNDMSSLFGNVSQISTADPAFVDELNGDYHLSSNSAAIDFCDELFVQSMHNDLNGKQRGVDDVNTMDFNGVYDLGAYEYQSNDVIFSNGFE